jgi:hypothetical protein
MRSLGCRYRTRRFRRYAPALLMPAVAAAPAIYTQEGTGLGLGVISNPDGTTRRLPARWQRSGMIGSETHSCPGSRVK